MLQIASHSSSISRRSTSNSRWRLGVALVALCGLPCSLSLAAAEQPAARDNQLMAEQTPIRAITLYRSGVGFFERRGLVQDAANIQLNFVSEQINDILKSMVVLDLDGGEITGISYSSKEPLQKRLASFGINIGDNPNAGEILSRLRGTAVTIQTPEGPASGTILNTEQRPTVYPGSGGAGSGSTVVHNLPWINLLTSNGVKSYNLTQVTGFQIDDPALANELNKALAAIAEQRADRFKTVDVGFRGQGARQVVLAYVHEMPVWKTSYRLVLPEPNPQGGDAGQPTVQGWAIVENTTDQDWNGVKLSLVAGRPVSFQMDLYEPLYVERPEIPVPMVAGVAPRIFEGGENFADKEALGRVAAKMAKPAAAPGAPMRASSRDRSAGSALMDAAVASEPEMSAEMLTGYAANAQAQAGEVGEVFQFTLKSPVDVKRQSSAMLPILSSGLEGKRVSIFNRNDGSKNPMRGVRLKNTSGLQLMPGPISVFDGAAYAGDAQIGHIPAGDTRLIAYAVDLDVSSLVKDESESNIMSLKIVQGVIEQTVKQRMTTTYAFSNKDAKRPRTVLVEHAKPHGWDLKAPVSALEETDALYRFEVPIEAGKDGALAVTHERIDFQRYGITDFSIDQLLEMSSHGKASRNVVEAFKKAATMQAEARTIEQRIQQLDQERQAISQDQSRLSELMKTIDRQTDLYKNYMGKLTRHESRLDAIAVQREQDQQALNTKRAELQAFLQNLNVE
jgi:hypothetical protein